MDIQPVTKREVFIQNKLVKTEELLKNSRSLSPQEDAKLKKACRDFESFFVYYLLKQMRATIPKDGALKGSRAEEFYYQMFDEAVAEKIAQTPKGIGLSSFLYEQLKHSIVKTSSDDSITPKQK